MEETKLPQLIINKLTLAQYNALEEIDPNQLYFITDIEQYVYCSKIVTVIDNASDDNHIPTAKAVNDLVKEETNKLKPLIYAGIQWKVKIKGKIFCK